MAPEAEINANLDRAKSSLDAARLLITGGHFDDAASRAYYSAFYASTAALLSEGLEFSRHSGTIGAVHQHFVKTGRLDTEFGRSLNWLFELRGVGDYGQMRHVPEDESQKAVEAAQAILEAILELLKPGV